MNKIGRIASWAAAIVLAGAVFSRSAEASFILDVNQVGPDVVGTGSGTIDLSGLTFEATQTLFAELKPQFSVAIVGATASAAFYIAATGPGNFGSGTATGPDTSSGNLVGIGAGGTTVAVPSGYVSGTALSDGFTYDNATYADLGVTPGTYTWSWGTPGTANFDTFVLDIHPASAAVPEPSTLAVLVAGLLGLGFLRRKPRRDAL